MGRIYLLALEEVVGKNAVNAILNQAGLRRRMNNYPPDNLDLGWEFGKVSAINRALVQIYGPEEDVELANRVGRAWFGHALPDFAAVLGIADLAFRLLPVGMRVKLGLKAIAETFRNTGDQTVRVHEQEDSFQYHIERCPECWGRRAGVSVCHTNLGLLQEGLCWATGSRQAQVEESACIARGDPSCTFVIAKHSIE
jgi:bacteriochlorophyll 4-vinyl reductase